MTGSTDAEFKMLEKVRRKTDGDPDFSAEERLILRKCISAIEFILTLGRVGKWLIAIMAALALALGSANTIWEALKEWFTG